MKHTHPQTQIWVRISNQYRYAYSISVLTLIMKQYCNDLIIQKFRLLTLCGQMDALIYCPHQTFRDVNDILSTAKIWLSANMLQLNEDKTHQILCTLKRYAPKDVEAVKLLYFWLEPKLGWDIHVSRTCTKPSRVIFLLQKLRLVISEKYLITLYYSLFHNHLSYGVLLWVH